VVQTVKLHVFPLVVADGPVNMATDELLLEKALTGMACCRWYAWEPATLSLGYFQHHEERLNNPLWRNVPWVRRATGGGAIWHNNEKTYALALPAEVVVQKPPSQWHEFLHRSMVDVLRHADISATVLEGQRPKQAELDFLCFTVPQPGDVIYEGRKIIGGAQRLKYGAFLQHGSLTHPAAGILQERWFTSLAKLLRGEVVNSEWTPEDQERIGGLVSKKYSQDVWNRKR
jgi:lipoyl(octanoyl) transferase